MEDFDVVKQDSDFICSQCHLFVKMYESFFPIAKRSRDTERICGDCIFDCLGEEDKTKYLCKTPQISGLTLVDSKILKDNWKEV